MIIATIERALVDAQLSLYITRLKDVSKLFKTWSLLVVNKAKANARAKGGRRLWRSIADYTKITRCTADGAVIECLTPIGAHKERGGPIKAKNGRYLTIPINDLARGKTVTELNADGIAVFRWPGTKTLGYVPAKSKTYVPLYALCEVTRPQKADKWWPSSLWVLKQGLKEAQWHVGKGQ